MSDDDDVPQLSVETFAALQEFYEEQECKTKSMTVDGDLDENWQLSQFWYDDSTVKVLGEITKKTIGECGGKIALMCCPTLYKSFKTKLENSEVHLFEYDKRFSRYGSDYIYYDYNNPLDVPNRSVKNYDLVIADPPFLSEECLSKTAETMKRIGKGQFLLCTGAVMEKLAEQLLGVQKTRFKPTHKNNLANDFCCYANFNINDFL